MTVFLSGLDRVWGGERCGPGQHRWGVDASENPVDFPRSLVGHWRHSFRIFQGYSLWQWDAPWESHTIGTSLIETQRFITHAGTENKHFNPFLIKELKRACVDMVPTLAFSKAGPREASFTDLPILCYPEVWILPMNAHPVLYVWGWDFPFEHGGIPLWRLNVHLQESCLFLRSSTTANTFHKMSNTPMSKSEDSKRVQGKGSWLMAERHK